MYAITVKMKSYQEPRDARARRIVRRCMRKGYSARGSHTMLALRVSGFDTTEIAAFTTDLRLEGRGR
jgi:hypothetical protein